MMTYNIIPFVYVLGNVNYSKMREISGYLRLEEQKITKGHEVTSGECWKHFVSWSLVLP